MIVVKEKERMQYTVGLVTQFGANPGVAYLKATKRILRYLKDTADYCLVLGR